MQVQITAPIHGAILNRHDGRQDDAGLHITVQGVVSEADTVTVNGVAATIIGATFTADKPWTSTRRCLRPWQNAAVRRLPMP